MKHGEVKLCYMQLCFWLFFCDWPKGLCFVFEAEEKNSHRNIKWAMKERGSILNKKYSGDFICDHRDLMGEKKNSYVCSVNVCLCVCVSTCQCICFSPYQLMEPLHQKCTVCFYPSIYTLWIQHISHSMQHTHTYHKKTRTYYLRNIDNPLIYIK